MCEAVAIGLSVAAANMAAQSAAQRSAANSQNKYRQSLGAAQNQQFEQTVESVKRDIGLQTDALMSQRLQMIDQQKQELQNITRDARQSSSSFRAVSAETGAEGRSIDLVHQQFEREVLDFESAAVRNITNYTMQVNREAQAIYSRGQSIINQGYPSPLPPPAQVNLGLIGISSITAGLNAGMSAYSTFQNPNPGSTPTSNPTPWNMVPASQGTHTGVGSLSWDGN
jgi:parvulin-like peptidyl-prolyl isomerase